MSLNKALNYMKLASSYVAEKDNEKALSCAMYALDTIEKAGILPNDFDRIEISEYDSIESEVPKEQLSLEFVIQQAKQ